MPGPVLQPGVHLPYAGHLHTIKLSQSPKRLVASKLLIVKGRANSRSPLRSRAGSQKFTSLDCSRLESQDKGISESNSDIFKGVPGLERLICLLDTAYRHREIVRKRKKSLQ